ncbi:MAG: hypothetical protein KatS3mg002_1674 [Candidatus Woesearchaeota archaeon]|nr:MAG: hypothetical protein KatS3mg002_1674 [Candidatus Woesearchaeota archaeon]
MKYFFLKSFGFICCFISFLFFSGCASTNITSFKDPDYENAKFNKILVLANTTDLSDRKELESYMVSEFSNFGIIAMESFRLFPPTRNLSDQEMIDLLLKNHIDAIITINVGESGVEEVYIPRTGSETKTKGQVNTYGNTANYKEKSTTTYYGGYTQKKPWAEFETKLFDVSNGNLVWIASSFTGGNAYANRSTIIYSYCLNTVEKLIEDGLITER